MVDIPSLVTFALSVNTNAMDNALNGLSDEDLTKRPSDHVNPIGWLLWHTYRVEDRYFSEIARAPQLWITERWHEKFGMAADPAQVGIGDSMEQVAAFKPTLANLQGYRAAVRQQTLSTLQNLTPEDLERDIEGPAGGPYKVGNFLGALLYDQFHHSGQVCYLRGLLSPDWSLSL